MLVLRRELERNKINVTHFLAIIERAVLGTRHTLAGERWLRETGATRESSLILM